MGKKKKMTRLIILKTMYLIFSIMTNIVSSALL